MAYSSPPPPPLQPRAVPPPPPPPPPPPQFHDTTLTLALALPTPQPLTWALPSSSPRSPPHARRPRLPLADDGAAFARVRSSPTTGDTPPCTECGKQFPSRKALFGHMRCHPERQWRGITPPPHFRHDQFTAQEREIATSLLMLAGGARPGAGKAGKKSLLGSPRWKESRGGTSAASSSSTAPATPPSRCDADHKCSVCHRGFATGQALGGHKRCHWEGACAQAVVAATASSRGSVLATSEDTAATTATALDLNLAPPPGPPLPWTVTNDRGGSLNAMLDLKLGY